MGFVVGNIKERVDDKSLMIMDERRISCLRVSIFVVRKVEQKVVGF